MTATGKLHKIDYADVLFWFGILIIIGWMIARIIGII